MKKSFYIFLCSLLGMMLILLLQRSLFLLAYLGGLNVLSPFFAGLDYWTFILATLGGLWYGIWLGLHWYKLVYEDRSVRGMIHGLRQALSSSRDSSVDGMVSGGRTWDLEDLMSQKVSELGAKGLRPALEVFERNTIAFANTGNSVSANAVHSRLRHPARKRVSAKRVATKKVTAKS